MRAVTVVDGQVTIGEHHEPSAGRGEVLVAVRSAGVNGADLMQVRGLYPAPPGSPPDIPGLELAGEVIALGDGASRFAVGDRVMAVVGGGGQAQRIALHERLLIAVPDGVDWVAAGGFPEVFTTAHDALFTQAGLRAGERLLVQGAAGGVGVAAVQLGHLAGARVCASVRAAELRDGVGDLGADEVVAPDAVAASGPFDVVLELVGAPNLGADIDALATGGRIVVIGVGAGAKAEVNLLSLMRARGHLMSSTLRARALEEKALCARRVEREVLPALADGRLRVPIAARYPLVDVAQAYERFQAGAKLGKIVIEMPPD